jgi:hypothetical protein
MPDSTVSIYDDDEIKKKQFHFFGEIGLNCFFFRKYYYTFCYRLFAALFELGKKKEIDDV